MLLEIYKQKISSVFCTQITSLVQILKMKKKSIIIWNKSKKQMYS